MDKNKNIKQEKQNFESALFQRSPSAYFKLKKHQTEARMGSSKLSTPVKLVIVVALIDVAVALFLTLTTKVSHFNVWGSLGIVVSIPWGLAFLDGFIFIVYGIYVIKRKKGELDIKSSTRGRFNTVIMEEEAAQALGLIYILLGIFLVCVVLVRMSIQGIF